MISQVVAAMIATQNARKRKEEAEDAAKPVQVEGAAAKNQSGSSKSQPKP